MNEPRRNSDALSQLYHALRTARRRLVICYLFPPTGTPVTVRELARHITAEENSIPQRAATGEPYRSVYNTLSQTHLPTLDDARIVQYNPIRQTVNSGPRLPVAALLIDVGRPIEQTLDAMLREQSDPQSTIE